MPDQPNSQLPVEPEPKFRGSYNRAEVHHLLWSGDITSTEFALLATIESFVDMSGEGCWASPAHLARLLHLDKSHLMRIVRRLIGKGLIVVAGNKSVKNRRRRVLETYYSRVRHSDTRWVSGAGATESVAPAPLKSIIFNNTIKKRTGFLAGARQPVARCSESESKTPKSPATNRNARCADLPNTEETMPLLHRPGPPSKITAQHLGWARRLRAVIVKEGRAGSWRIKKWADQFRLAEGEFGAAKVEDILSLYERFHSEVKRPKIINPEHFRKNVRNEWLPDVLGKLVSSRVEVDPKIKIAAEELLYLGWPKGSKGQVALTFQLCVEQARAFRAKLKPVAESPRKKSGNAYARIDDPKAVASFLLLQPELKPLDFARRWLAAAHRRIAGWDDWSGNLLREVPTTCPPDKHFDRYVMEDVIGDQFYPKRWDELKQVMFSKDF